VENDAFWCILCAVFVDIWFADFISMLVI